jgi:hypothetical protein
VHNSSNRLARTVSRGDGEEQTESFPEKIESVRGEHKNVSILDVQEPDCAENKRRDYKQEYFIDKEIPTN